jgi:NADH-quinone oxidoreductase subunit L
MKNLILIIPILPFIGFLINGLLRKYLPKTVVGIIGSGTVLASFIASVMVFFRLDELTGKQITKNARIISEPVVSYFDFINIPSLKIPFAFQIDQLSAIFLLIITGVSFLIHVYSTAYMHEEKREHFGRYFSFLNLFVFFHVAISNGSQLCNNVHWLGRCWFVFLSTNWILV